MAKQQRNTSYNRKQTAVLPRFLIASEVAEAVRKSVKTIYRWAKQGKIPSINLHGSVLFDPDVTLKWIENFIMAS
jgi:predicted DNA-binding transcriptional regulator AlpA